MMTPYSAASVVKSPLSYAGKTAPSGKLCATRIRTETAILATLKKNALGEKGCTVPTSVPNVFKFGEKIVEGYADNRGLCGVVLRRPRRCDGTLRCTMENGVKGSETGGVVMPDLTTEYMVNMSCEGCVRSVRSKLESMEGVKSVDINLANQVVRVLGSASTNSLTCAIEQTGREARLIGQGLAQNFAISAGVAEFKGTEIHGVVRFVQLANDLIQIEATVSGLPPGLHGWSINTYGDLTQGAASTGGIFSPLSAKDTSSTATKALGDLGMLEVDSTGVAEYSGTKSGLQVADLIGRAVVLYASEDKTRDGICASVIARSAGVGENYKRLCTCDGTVIWEATNNDFVRL